MLKGPRLLLKERHIYTREGQRKLLLSTILSVHPILIGLAIFFVLTSLAKFAIPIMILAVLMMVWRRRQSKTLTDRTGKIKDDLPSLRNQWAT